MNLGTIEWKSMLFVVVVLFVSLVGIKLIDKIKPSKEELEDNNRSRSSILRVIEKL